MVQPEVYTAPTDTCVVSITGKAFSTKNEHKAEFEQRWLLATVTNFLLQKHQINMFYEIRGKWFKHID